MSSRHILMFACIDVTQSNACTLHVSGIANGFADLGHGVTILVPAPKDGLKSALHLRDTVNVRYFKTPLAFRIPNALRIFFALPALFSEFNKKPDLFYTRSSLLNALALGFARLWNIKSVSEHNGLTGEEMTMLGQVKRLAPLGDWLQRLDCHAANKVAVVTPNLKTRLADTGVPADKIFVSGNATDTKLFRPMDRDACLQKFGFDPARKYIGFIGTLAEWQGVSVLIDAFKVIASRFADWDVIIVGSGPQLEPLRAQALALELKNRVHFTGHMNLANVPEAVNCFDIGTTPLLHRRNAAIGVSSVKIRDYAATGLPILAARVPGNAELEDAEILHCHTPEDITDLAEKLSALMSDPDLRRALGHKALSYARENFDWTFYSKQALVESGITESNAV